MRRRQSVGADAPPPELRRYDPGDWAGDAQAFYDALAAWREAHPGIVHELDGPWPDVPFDRESL